VPGTDGETPRDDTPVDEAQGAARSAPPGAEAPDEDALYVLTATLLTPARFPSALGDDYPAACAELGLEPFPDGYGLVLGQDGLGARWTVATSDTALVAVAIATWDCGMEYDLSPDERTIVASLPGWPLELAVAAPGLPEPHDPPEEDGGPPLSPPDTTAWGPAQRRLGADEIALQWKTWRGQLDDPKAVPADGADSASGADSGSGSDAEADSDSDSAGVADAAGPKHPGVRRVLNEAKAYADSPPPLGRIRSSFAEGGARALRVDGPGWSMVARTDDIAFVLLDDEPGEVIPVGRGPELPGLLAALDKVAVRTDH
jgi:hypothetical protein